MEINLRDARTLRREPIRERDVSLARSLAARGSQWRELEADPRRAVVGADGGSSGTWRGDLLGVPLG